jgi:AraC family transcriptional regulator
MEQCLSQSRLPIERKIEAQFDRRRLAEILLQASDVIDTDHLKAKRYLLHAASLLWGDGSSQCLPPRQEKGLCSWQVQQVKTFIESNLDTRIMVKDLAARCRLSVGHLSRGFKRAFGKTPQGYIRERRILRAKALMLSSNDSLAGIAVVCGLCDQAHLSRIFLRIVGETPNAWRRQARRADHPDGVPPLQAASHEPAAPSHRS